MGFGYRVYGLRVWGTGHRVWGIGFRLQGIGHRVVGHVTVLSIRGFGKTCDGDPG